MDSLAVFEQATDALRRGDLPQAEALYRQLLAAHPGHPVVSHLMGVLRVKQGRREEALELMQAALTARPDDTQIMLDISNTLGELNRNADVLALCDRALAIRPDYFEALNNRANALRELERPAEALDSIDAALRLKPGDAPLWYNRGLTLAALRKIQEALDSYDRALALQPGYGEAANNKGALLHSLDRRNEALAVYEAALVLQPDKPGLLLNRGFTLMAERRFAEALASYDRLLAVAPHFPKALSQAAWAALNLCDWTRTAALAPRLTSPVNAPGLEPLTALLYCSDGALQLAYARNAVRDAVASGPAPLWTGKRYHHEKIRVAYLSADFRAHPVAFQVTGVLEHHDKTRFETIGLSLNKDDGSAARTRMVQALDRFTDVAGLGMRAIAGMLRELEVDIVVDLGGHTAGSGIAALSHRPCPVQVSWLGYPGTTGADFMDYILGDAIVTPFGQQDFFSEKIVQLPGSFFPTDRRAIGKTPSRAENGLPEKGFVFCCFNNSWKLAAATWDIWMRLLEQVPGSVLWLRYGDEPGAMLQRAAQARGIDPARLVFAGAASDEDHLARIACADLFLDTLPYNAHATAADALWTGLPVLTQMGEMFAGRVAASLLTAVGLPELITTDAREYEALALALARDPARLKDLRGRLAVNRTVAPLFDSARFARGLEAAYTAMLESDAPRSFAVNAQAVR